MCTVPTTVERLYRRADQRRDFPKRTDRNCVCQLKDSFDSGSINAAALGFPTGGLLASTHARKDKLGFFLGHSIFLFPFLIFVPFFCSLFQINGVFDTISYSKGASVLRMLDNVILEEGEFIAGISSFLVRQKSDARIRFPKCILIFSQF